MSRKTEAQHPELLADEALDAAAGGKIVFSDLIVSSYQTGGASADGPKPIESLSLSTSRRSAEPDPASQERTG